MGQNAKGSNFLFGDENRGRTAKKEGEQMDLFDQEPECQAQPVKSAPVEQEYYEPGSMPQKKVTPVFSKYVSEDNDYPELTMPQAPRAAWDVKIISIGSTKGGSGKSTLSKEFGYAFSDDRYTRGKKKQKVLIIDFNFSNPNIASIFKVTNERNIGAWCRLMHKHKRDYGRIPLNYDPKIINSAITHIPSRKNMDLMLLPSDPAECAAITPEMVTAIIENVKNSAELGYDVIVIDNVDSRSDDRMVQAMKMSDKVLLTCGCENTSIGPIGQFLGDLEEQRFNMSKIAVVIYKTQQTSSITSMDVKQHYRFVECLGPIEYEPDAADINNTALPIIYTKSKSPFADSLWELAEQVIPAPEQKKKGFFARLFGR